MVAAVALNLPILSRAVRRATLQRAAAFRHMSTTSVAADATPSIVRWAVLPWTFFIGENVVLSHNRSSIIDYFGDEAKYHTLYNGVSTVACASLAYGYLFRVHAAAPPLRKVSTLAVAAGFVLQALGLAGIAQAAPRIQLPIAAAPDAAPASAGASPAAQPKQQWLVRCPMDFEGDANKKVTSPDGLHGLHRVSRHPLLWSLGAVGLGGALAVASVPQAIWLTGPAMMALIGGGHIDYRRRRGEGGTLSAEAERVTSLVPFVAMAMGAQAEGALGSLQALTGELKVENAVVGVLLAARWAVTRRF